MLNESMKDFSSSLLDDSDNDFADLYERQAPKEKSHKLKFACKLIWIIVLVVVLFLGLVAGVCYALYSRIKPPPLVCTYSVDAVFTSTIKATRTSRASSLRLYSSAVGGGDVMYAETSVYPHNETRSFIGGGVCYTDVPFFDRRVCTKMPGAAKCLSISPLATRAKWRTPCPSDPNVTCEVYTRKRKWYNETWYVFPEGHFPEAANGARVPSAYYFGFRDTTEKVVFKKYNFTPPDPSFFAFTPSGYCYEIYNSSFVRFAYSRTARSFVPTARAYELINRPTAREDEGAEEQPAGWVKGDNPCFDGLTYADVRLRLADDVLSSLALTRQRPVFKARSHSSSSNAEPPEAFECEERWPQCESMKAIRDQGSCGSYWAFGVSEVLADRTCVTTGANLTLSPQYLMDCVSMTGCTGWVSDLAWDALGVNGTTAENCTPYVGHAATCSKKCADGSNPTFYKSRDAYSIYTEGNFSETARLIQLDIMENGPVAASMYVYDDLYKYKSGVYYHGKSASYVGKHIVKIVGWGVDKETTLPYWRVASSWSTSFGEDGYFRILRGYDESGIEYGISAGLPVL